MKTFTTLSVLMLTLILSMCVVSPSIAQGYVADNSGTTTINDYRQIVNINISGDGDNTIIVGQQSESAASDGSIKAKFQAAKNRVAAAKAKTGDCVADCERPYSLPQWVPEEDELIVRNGDSDVFCKMESPDDIDKVVGGLLKGKGALLEREEDFLYTREARLRMQTEVTNEFRGKNPSLQEFVDTVKGHWAGSMWKATVGKNVYIVTVDGYKNGNKAIMEFVELRFVDGQVTAIDRGWARIKKAADKSPAEGNINQKAIKVDYWEQIQ